MDRIPFLFLFSNHIPAGEGGGENTKPDTLKWWSRDLPNKRNERYQNVSMVIKPQIIMRLLADSLPGQGQEPIKILWKEGIAADS